MSKGAGFLTLKEVWTEILPAADLALVVASMDEEARAVWNRPPLAVTWMPQRPAFELHRRIEQCLGPRALPLAEEVARRIMHRNFSSVYKVLIRMATIDYVITRAEKYYTQYTKNQGTLTSRRTGPTSSWNRYDGIPDATLIHAYFLGGAGLGLIELVGAKHPKVVRREARPAERVIELEFSWLE
jgi:hypothetical protein